MLVELAEVHSESSELYARFKNDTPKEDVLRKVSHTGELNARLRPSLWGTCSAWKRTSRSVLFSLHEYRRLVSEFQMAGDTDLMEEKEELRK